MHKAIEITVKHEILFAILLESILLHAFIYIHSNPF